jgi:hypothetical protein
MVGGALPRPTYKNYPKVGEMCHFPVFRDPFAEQNSSEDEFLSSLKEVLGGFFSLEDLYFSVMLG